MRAGLMRDRIDLQSPAPTSGDWGQAEGWATQATVWAQVTPLTGTEKLNDTEIQSVVTHKISMRYRSDVTSQWRAIYRDQVLDFLTVIDVDGLKAELQIDAREYPTNG